MSNEKSLVVVPQREVTLETVETAQAIAKMAGMFRLQPDQAAIAMLTGYELGFGLVTSLRYIDIIQTSNGMQPALRAQAMEALINQSGVYVSKDRNRNGGSMIITVSVSVGESRWDDRVCKEAEVRTEHKNPTELPWEAICAGLVQSALKEYEEQEKTETEET